MSDGERLQKFLARCGIGSRRHCEAVILAGRVRVNGAVVTTLGTRVGPGDIVTVDGRTIQPERKVYLLLHKPVGVVTTVHDPQGRKTVLDLVPSHSVRIYPVGRLDYDTSGLLILTNDGGLTHALTHPSREVDKTYRVRIKGELKPGEKAALEKGIRLEDGWTAPADLKFVASQKNGQDSIWEVTIHEGRNRQIRRMFAAVGHPVLELKRIRFGPLTLDNLAPGRWRYLKTEEVEALRQSARSSH